MKRSNVYVYTSVQVLELCFQLYGSKESSVRNTAGVAIRQIVFSLFERLDNLVEEEGVSAVGGATNQLPTQANDAYLLFQVRFGPSVCTHIHWCADVANSLMCMIYFALKLRNNYSLWPLYFMIVLVHFYIHSLFIRMHVRVSYRILK